MGKRQNQHASATDHIRLRQLFKERAGMSQKEFGKRYGIGSQSMVAQHLSGKKPLTYDAAIKYAHGLRCTIYQICPGMAEEIMPVLGKRMRRAATLALLTVTQFFSQSDARAGQFDIITSPITHCVRFLRRMRELLITMELAVA